MKLGTILALILIVAGLLFLWVVFFRLPLEPEAEEATEDIQYRLDEELNQEQPTEDTEESAPTAPETTVAAATPAAMASNDSAAATAESELKKN